MRTLQTLKLDVQDSVYAMLHDNGCETKDQYDALIYEAVIEHCCEVVLRNIDIVHSIIYDYGVLKAVMKWNNSNEPALDYETANRDWFGQQLLMEVLRQETSFSYEEYSQRYNAEQTTEVFEMTD